MHVSILLSSFQHLTTFCFQNKFGEMNHLQSVQHDAKTVFVNLIGSILCHALAKCNTWPTRHIQSDCLNCHKCTHNMTFDWYKWHSNFAMRIFSFYFPASTLRVRRNYRLKKPGDQDSREQTARVGNPSWSPGCMKRKWEIQNRRWRKR